MSFGSTGSLSQELAPLHPDPPNHALTPNVAKSKPYRLSAFKPIVDHSIVEVVQKRSKVRMHDFPIGCFMIVPNHRAGRDVAELVGCNAKVIRASNKYSPAGGFRIAW